MSQSGTDWLDWIDNAMSCTLNWQDIMHHLQL